MTAMPAAFGVKDYTVFIGMSYNLSKTIIENIKIKKNYVPWQKMLKVFQN